MQKIKYVPEMCECCGQSTTYILAIDHGTSDILKKIARFIGKKGVNAVHPRKEMEGIYLTSNQVGNLSRPRFHGLIAAVRDNPGNYLLTPKGAKFLRGEPVPKYAIISKAESRQIGYFEPDLYKATVLDFDDPSEYWEGINYEVIEGDIIKSLFA
jgi:hypothetical protein